VLSIGNRKGGQSNKKAAVKIPGSFREKIQEETENYHSGQALVFYWGVLGQTALDWERITRPTVGGEEIVAARVSERRQTCCDALV